MFLFLLTSATFLYHGNGIPLALSQDLQDDTQPAEPNTTAKSEVTFVGWQPNPRYRGTLDLLISCILTYVLCAYTVLHLDVLPSKAMELSRFQYYKYLASRWVIWGLRCIIFPESVLLRAYRERTAARKLTETIKGFINEAKKGNSDMSSDKGDDCKKRKQWTNTHSFVCIAGGFVFDFGGSDHEGPYDNSRRIRITSAGMALIGAVDIDQLPDISVEELQDKSKATWLTKLLICSQASWLIVQVFARLASSLNASLLELNTAAHISFTIAAYHLWWDKPQNMEQPFVVKKSNSDILASWLWCYSNSDLALAGLLSYAGTELKGDHIIGTMDVFQAPNLNIRNWYSLEFNKYLYLYTHNTDSTSDSHPQGGNHGYSKMEFKPYGDFGDQKCSTGKHVLYTKANTALTESFICTCNSVETSGLEMQLWIGQGLWMGPSEITRLKLASEAAVIYPVLALIWRSKCSMLDRNSSWLKDIFAYEALPSYASEGADMGEVAHLPEHFLFFQSTMFLGPCAFVYGLLHGIALLDYDFATPVEHLLWKIALGGIAVFLILLAVAVVVQVHMDCFGFNTSLTQTSDGKARKWIAYPLLTTFFAARTYLLVESFVSLRSVPVSVYKTPDWTGFIPHL